MFRQSFDFHKRPKTASSFVQTLQIYLSQAIFREAGYFYRAIIIISEKQLSHCINLSVKQIEMQIEVDKFGQ